MRQFHQITAALQDAGNQQDAAKLEDLKAKRRDVWDLLAIARARAAGAAEPPLLSLEAVQRVLAPDEAVLGYFFLAPTVLLIVKMDRQRFDVERIVFNSEDEMAPVNDLLEAIEGLAAERAAGSGCGDSGGGRASAAGGSARVYPTARRG